MKAFERAMSAVVPWQALNFVLLKRVAIEMFSDYFVFYLHKAAK